MALKQMTPTEDLLEYMDTQLMRMRKALLYNLNYLGKKVVTHARDENKPNTFKTQTGNLRSSMGYVIVEDGKILDESNFEVKGNGKDGADLGRKGIRELAGIYNKGLVLIVVAGMNYATYVAKKGYDVLDSAELLARREVPRMLDMLSRLADENK